MRHALVKNGQVVEFRDYAPNVDQSKLPEGKPRQLPVETLSENFDPVSQILEGPTYEIESTRVIERYKARAKNEGEIVEMIAAKDAEIDAEFMKRYCAPILHEVGGVEYEFHADGPARENIQGVLDMYNEGDRMGQLRPDPRPWTPKGAPAFIMITRDELALLGIAIGARKDALYVIKKGKQLALAALTDPAEINAVDPLNGWDL